MDITTKLAYRQGMLLDRYWYQLNGKSAQENYSDQILVRQDDEEEVFIRSEVSIK